MTQKAADDQFEDLRLDEENELLDFAKGLDFDRYMGDVEVAAVMERLCRRIADLERDVATEDLRNLDAETRAAMRAKLEQMVHRLLGRTSIYAIYGFLTKCSLLCRVTLMNEDRRGGGQSEESAAMSAARALLQDEDDLTAIHSAKSAAALLKTAKDKIAQIKSSVNPGPAPNSQPRIVNEVRLDTMV